jgi:UDP:flavonoid glycosyltransferase YjiC (YdhE family)
MSTMHIGIQTWGSDGDVRPLMALAGGLKSSGQDVTLAVTNTENRDYTSISQELGIDYIKVPENIVCDMSQLGEHIRQIKNRVKALKFLAREIYFRYLDDMFSAAKRLCEACDLVVGHFTVFPLKMAAVQTGTPYVSTILFRGCVPSVHRPPGRFPDLGRIGNTMEWKIIQDLIDFIFKRDVKQFWKKGQLKAPRHVLPDAWESDRLNLIAASRVFCPPQPDWESKYYVCGYFHLPDSLSTWQMPRQLQEFLDTGEKPVYMTFGLLQPYYQKKNIELMLKATKLSGCRAIIQTTAADYPPHSTDGDVYFIDRAPHHQIFPECAAVVHHGGGGTAHSVTLCDRPSVVVGFSNEHMAYGQDLYCLGAAPKPIRYRKATAERIAIRIDDVLKTSGMQKRAAELGDIMRDEKGVEKAAELILRLGFQGA